MVTTVGAVFPLSRSDQANRIFLEGRTVFVKYTKFKDLR